MSKNSAEKKNNLETLLSIRYKYRGCPQGSTFGPLLWNIFQNDLTFNVCNCPLSLYADDHQLYVIGRRIQDEERTLNDESNNVSNWYLINALQGNFSKYQAVRFGPKSTDRYIDIVITDIRGKLSDIKTTEGIRRWPNEFQRAYWQSYEKGIKTEVLEFYYVCEISYHSRLNSRSIKPLYYHY